MLAEVADDHVHATAFGNAATISRWREIEVELGIAGSTVLHSIGRRIRRAGARPSPFPSKLARALGHDDAHPTSVSRGSRTLTDYVRAQIQEVIRGDVALRNGDDPIHDTRVAVRRLRSTFRTFKKAFDEGAVRDLDTELTWYGALLGEVRDHEVLRHRFAGAIAEIPVELVLGPVATTVEQRLFTAQLDHRKRSSRRR